MRCIGGGGSVRGESTSSESGYENTRVNIQPPEYSTERKEKRGERMRIEEVQPPFRPRHTQFEISSQSPCGRAKGGRWKMVASSFARDTLKRVGADDFVRKGTILKIVIKCRVESMGSIICYK